MGEIKKRVIQVIGLLLVIGVVILLLKNPGMWEEYTRNNQEQKYTATYTDVFDTVTQIIGYAESEEAFEEKAEQIHERLKLYHTYYDIYNSYEGVNNLKTINDQAGIAPVAVSEEIIELLQMGKEMYQITDGKVNIAMGSVLQVWHEARTRGIEEPKNAALPSMELLEQQAAYMDISQLQIDEENKTVFVADENMSIDVGSIGKGYAADRIAEYAREIGMENVLISIGGNVIAIGTKEEGQLWKVGIQNPDAEAEPKYIAFVQVQDKSVVTSGDYQRYYTVDGKRYCHIINPDTLMPNREFHSVTVIGEQSGIADALSTALFNMTYEEGLELINGMEGIEAMWVHLDGTKSYSQNFKQYLD